MKKNFMGKSFQIDIFVLKHVLDHSKSIPTKKFFSKNFRKIFVFWPFLPFLGPKNRFFDFLGGENLNFFSPISKGLYCGHFAPLHASLRLLSTAGSLDLSNFWPKMAKNIGFSKIWGRKNFFSKKNFVPFFSTFYCGSFEPSNSYVSLTIAEIFRWAIFCSFLIRDITITRVRSSPDTSGTPSAIVRACLRS